ncbi:hypothetical protein A2U01_0106426, partial [Trifolium medium]|nr:hypothetical protein [Trifolium medium]
SEASVTAVSVAFFSSVDLALGTSTPDAEVLPEEMPLLCQHQ